MTGQVDLRRERGVYIVGLICALTLTCAAFAVVAWHLASAGTTLAIVFGLGLIQIICHFRFFLHIDLRKNAREDLQLILFSGLITLLMVGGTMIVLFNLRHRMM
jgi:cytochrome o ubiquinol oxidase operon protein cyoD